MEIVSKYHVTDDQIINEKQYILAAKLNPEKFDYLYEKYYEQIFRFLFQRLDNKDVAFDLTQQVFLNAMLNIKNYEDRGLPFSAWLYRIALNELKQYFRKNKNARTLNVGIEDLKEMIDEMDDSTDEERIEKIIIAMQKLKENELQLVEMRFFEKRSFKEIGTLLSCTENNAKVKLYRVLDRIKKFI